MYRMSMIALSVAVLLEPVAATSAYAQSRTVTTQPTLQTLPPGRAVLFDNKKCPAGQIARYARSKMRDQISIKCVHITGLGK
ncbi:MULTISPECIES: DUF6719 family protein [Rhizobium/Agrobacterium group]|uniref:DUF6719 family protein n=2 Tax=Neorhizobium TaxID=1525371 RepID=A0ABV0LZ66_9HYPH|nr:MULTISPECIES: DUF6719 family protein [Rhizobium/Agrobacterium group]KGD87743.1 hypothetical protein JL39_26290 [Rhizobium sp. YS-1r]MCC2612189.1 hypothetical protein [Neorhizobium petrolearium]WGI67339.1 hypothetical protein QEO92_20405 [Neorhizobium petrolearium]